MGIIDQILTRRFVQTEIKISDDDFDKYLVQFHGLVGNKKHIAFAATKKDLEQMRDSINCIIK